ncbi:MAG: gliding motility-associated C-terminal domain-containing protein [Bacteroidota bacterium]
MWRVAVGFVLVFWSALLYGQNLCFDNTSTLLPLPTISDFKNFGYNFDIQGDVLVVTESQSDLQSFRGGTVHVYLYVEGEWVRQTSILPATAVIGLQLGRDVAITDHAIAVIARPQNSVGNSQDVLYVFAKSPNDPWSALQEVYAGPIDSSVPETDVLQVFDMDFAGSVLAVSYLGDSQAKTNIYEYDTDQGLVLESVLVTPADSSGADGQRLEVAVGQDLVAIGVGDFQGSDGESSGQTFVYQRKTDGSWPSSPSATLLPSLPKQQRFGADVVVWKQTIVVACNYGAENGLFEPKAFVYEQPAAGWEGQIQEEAILSTGQTGSYFSGVVLAANDNYVFYGKSIEAAVSVFKKQGDNWRDQATRTALIFSPVFGLNFGDEIKSNNDHFVMNLPGDLTDTEFTQQQVFTFEPPGGSFESIESFSTLLEPADSSATSDAYGSQLAINGNWMAVTASNDDVYGPESGAVYVYNRTTVSAEWSLVEVLRSPDQIGYEQFGSALALRDNRLFVAALGNNGGEGQVYVYRWAAGRWREEARIRSPEVTVPGTPIDNSRLGFGRAIAVNDDVLAISQINTSNTDDRGRVHLFSVTEENSWKYVGSLRPEAETKFDFFGRDVAMEGDLIVVGTGAPVSADPQGAKVYVFKKGAENWQSATEDAQLINLEQGIHDQFGFSVDVHGDLILVGAIKASPHGFENHTQSGSAYLFRRPTKGWSGAIPPSALLYPRVPLENNYFGYDVHIDDQYLSVSAPHSAEEASESLLNLSGASGSVYVFDRSISGGDTLLHEKHVIASGNAGALFGKHVTSDGRHLMVSASRVSTDVGFFSGAVYAWDPYPYITPLSGALCVSDEPIDLSAEDESSGTWSGAGIVNTEQGIFDPSTLLAGEYIVSFESQGCLASTVVAVSEPLQVMTRTAEPVGICEGGITTLAASFDRPASQLAWSFRENQTETFQLLLGLGGEDTVVVASPGEYLLEYGNGGCTDVLSFLVGIDNNNPPVIVNRSPIELKVCAGGTDSLFVDVGSQGVTDYTWRYRPTPDNEYEMILSDGEMASLPVGLSGQYQVVVANGVCQTILDFNVVAPDFKAKISATGDLVLCEDEAIRLTVSPAEGVENFQWSFRPSESFVFESLQDDSPALDVFMPGSYFYEFFAEGCAFVSDTVEVTTPIAEINLELASVLCGTDEVVPLVASPPGGSWLVDGEPLEGDALVTSQFFNGQYQLTYRVNQQGCWLEETTEVRVAIVGQDEVANAFSPNGDGINDVFNPEPAAGLPAYNFQVFDRSGVVAYETRDATQSWDGRGQQPGTYFWTVTYFDECASEQTRRSGIVQLLR